jgi:hypothetical protein
MSPRSFMAKRRRFGDIMPFRCRPLDRLRRRLHGYGTSNAAGPPPLRQFSSGALRRPRPVAPQDAPPDGPSHGAPRRLRTDSTAPARASAALPFPRPASPRCGSQRAARRRSGIRDRGCGSIEAK